MDVFFTASALQGSDYGSYYRKIVSRLKKKNHKVMETTVRSNYHQVLKWISAADLVVPEISFPSGLDVGHQITIALERGKPVICLYLRRKVSIT